MKRTSILAATVVLTVLAIAGSAHADAFGRIFGLGLVAGSPGGINAKVFLAGDHALDATVGFSFLGGRSLTAHLDYLYHLPVADTPDVRVEFYPGIGPTFDFAEAHEDRDERFHFGARVPLGLVFLINYFVEEGAPIDLFVEVGPGLRFYDHTAFTIDGGIGARYWF